MKIVIKVPRKTRAHRVLFRSDTPFKPKVVQTKKGVYQRRPKHRNQKNDE
jgi:hypothetical protein